MRQKRTLFIALRKVSLVKLKIKNFTKLTVNPDQKSVYPFEIDEGNDAVVTTEFFIIDSDHDEDEDVDI